MNNRDDASMDATPNLKMPYILPAQAQKHVTHNEALRALDALVQLSVASRSLAAPPVGPAEGARYIVGTTASGEWSGQDARIAAWQDGAWAFFAPIEGWIAFVADVSAAYVFKAGGWSPLIDADAFEINPAPLVGVNATADATNRLSVSSPATLLNHEGAGHQLKINKLAVSDTASLLFQTDFGGRAEIGLAGDDQLRVKVSADGATWREAARFDPASGEMACSRISVQPTQPNTTPLRVRGLAGQSADILSVETSAGVQAIRVDSSGTVRVNTNLIPMTVFNADFGINIRGPLQMRTAASFNLGSGNFLQWKASVDGASGTASSGLFMDAANALGQRNGTQPQKWSLYETESNNTANHSRIAIAAQAGAAFEIRTEAAGTGVRRAIVLNGANRSTKINDPSGGATIDAESRAAINAIIDALEAHGISAG
jgi:hypothetical protein